MNISVKPTRLEWMTSLALMPVLSVLLNYLLFGDRMMHELRIWLQSFPVICLAGFCSWYLHIIAMHWLQKMLPDIRQTIIRLLLLMAAHIGLTFLTFIVVFYSYDAFRFLGYTLDPEQLRMSVFLAIGLTMVATTLWEADNTLKKWKASLGDKEKLKQLALQDEYDTLKSQVNPHFLFNCFNTLSSLIPEDKDRAAAFLDELSKVYRYLLQNNEQGLSTVQQEIRFLQSYLHLLQTRYGSAIRFQIEIDKKYELYFLPSLSLQMLVENAVKHNALSKKVPLSLDIFTTEDNKLIINNNLQPRSVKSPSNQVGLKNIRIKYELLKRDGFQVITDDKSFTVVLPLIWSSDHVSRASLLHTAHNHTTLN